MQGRAHAAGPRGQVRHCLCRAFPLSWRRRQCLLYYNKFKTAPLHCVFTAFMAKTLSSLKRRLSLRSCRARAIERQWAVAAEPEAEQEQEPAPDLAALRRYVSAERLSEYLFASRPAGGRLPRPTDRWVR